MFRLVCHPLQAAVCFLHPPIPHIPQRPLRFAYLAYPDWSDKVDGRDCHVPRSASIPRLGSVFPPVVRWYRSASSYCADRLRAVWLRPNCRWPCDTDEGSVDDSHVLTVRVGSLATTFRAIRSVIAPRYRCGCPIGRRRCRSSFTPQGWPLAHVDLVN